MSLPRSKDQNKPDFFADPKTTGYPDFSRVLDKPLVGFEPTTYALPWRYSTTELKGLIYHRVI